MRDDLPPVPPERLSRFAAEVLTLLAGRAAAAEIVIGGGVALGHYLDYRDTFDLDAWWASAPTQPAIDAMKHAVLEVGNRHGLAFASRSWGETMSFELLDGGRKVFSLQIASRDRYLDPTLEAAWPPVRLETLRDNVASKMTALVERAAPRDLRDIHELCRRELVSPRECWELYSAKHPTEDSEAAATKVLHAVERLEMQRPLHTIEAEPERQAAEGVRRWFREVFCRELPQ
jgi:hypothetical protein